MHGALADLAERRGYLVKGGFDLFNRCIDGSDCGICDFLGLHGHDRSSFQSVLIDLPAHTSVKLPFDVRSYVITYADMSQASELTEPDNDAPAVVGRRVRAIREARGLSLRDLAQRSRVSAPMLSQVERGETSPTIAIAQRIAYGLDLSLSTLLRLDEERHVAIVRRADRRTERRDGHRVAELTPSLPGERASVTLHALRPGGRTGGPDDEPLHAPGSRETVVALAGRLMLHIDGEKYSLAEGDAVTFDADLPHHFENKGAREVRFMAVVTSGLRAI
jgi:XRE family transcriptional regulator, regulator of sulfur utilization